MPGRGRGAAGCGCSNPLGIRINLIAVNFDFERLFGNDFPAAVLALKHFESGYVRGIEEATFFARAFEGENPSGDKVGHGKPRAVVPAEIQVVILISDAGDGTG